MIGIQAAAYTLGQGRGDVGDWCRSQSRPLCQAAALLESGSSYYHFAEGASLEDLAAGAIQQLLDDASVTPSEIDVLILYHTSQCNILPMPHTLAGRLRARLGLSGALAFSIAQQQCVSPVHALRVLDALFIRHPVWRYAIVAGADKILREDLRAIGTSGIHSDAGAAMLVGRTSSRGISGLFTYNDPKAAMGFLPDGSYEPNSNYLWSLISAMRKIARLAGVHLADLAGIIPHNVNKPAWLKALDALRIPRQRLFSGNFATKGHAFGSDIAINLADSGALKDAGSYLVLVSGIGGCFGGFISTTEARS